MKFEHNMLGQERIIISALSKHRLNSSEQSELLEEIKNLAQTAGVDILGKIIQNRPFPDAAYYFGSGKAEEIKNLAISCGANAVVVDGDLSPAQLRNLEKIIGLKVIDRTELILHIFAIHASTHQAKIQIELASLKYLLPRLKRMWTHLSREAAAGGPGIGLRGTGEKQIELDRRLAGKRIKMLQSQLKGIQERRKRDVKKRSANTTLSLVGYTNAGKSTLMNKLTAENVKVENKLFSTLDTKTAVWTLPNRQRVLISDTVGFIKNIPHALIASFHATLEEVVQADLLLIVVDACSRNVEEQIEAVMSVLKELNCSDKPHLLIFNKIDSITDHVEFILLKRKYPDAVEVSAKHGAGLDKLNAAIMDFVEKKFEHISEFSIPLANGKALAFVEERAIIFDKKILDDRIVYDMRIGPRDKSVLINILTQENL